MKALLVANDVIWISTAIICIFYENAWTTAIVCLTTAVYAIDLFVKLKNLDFNIKEFAKAYWLDVLFLIPFVKIARGFRIFKFGRLLGQALKTADVVADLSEMAFRSIKCLQRLMQGSRKKFKKLCI